MRRLRNILLVAPVLLAVGLWGCSYRWMLSTSYSATDSPRWLILSDVGAIYLGWRWPSPPVGWMWRVDETNPAASFEEGFGLVADRRLPARYMTAGTPPQIGLFVVPWWVVTAACTLPAVWSWRRRRKDEARGFEVEPVQPVDAA